MSLDAACWPLASLGEATARLGRLAGLSAPTLAAGRDPESAQSADAVGPGERIEHRAEQLGWAARDHWLTVGDLETLDRRRGPFLLELPPEVAEASSSPEAARTPSQAFLLVVSIRDGEARLALPGGGEARASIEALRHRLEHGVTAAARRRIESLLDAARVPPARRRRVAADLLREQMGPRRLARWWTVEPEPGASPWEQARALGLWVAGLRLLAFHAAATGLWIASWWWIGRVVLEGRTEPGWLTGWVLLLLCLLPLRALASWSQGQLSVGFGGLLKRRLLEGALRLEADEIRREGSGRLLARSFETEAVESLALSGGFALTLALVELVFAVWVLSVGAGGPIHGLLLAVWCTLPLAATWRYAHHRRRWTDARLEMTNGLVEGMLGARTRWAQCSPERWHVREDRDLAGYLDLSERLDRFAARAIPLLGRGWLVVGLAGLGPALLAGGAAPGRLGASIGGVILAYRALAALTGGLTQGVQAWVSWERIRHLFEAASRPRAEAGLVGAGAPSTGLALQARGLAFRYPNRESPVLAGCDARLQDGDRVVLRGASGSGKSTFAAVLAGLRRPSRGLLMAGGYDPQALGMREWRRRVVLAPQFHDNHVFTGTLAFNVLLGRRWPPREEDLAAAEEVCHELGLGDLLGKMPSGILQVVGECGWQLSHGERSRVFVARALLQGARVVLLDESFGALDPSAFLRCLETVRRRSACLVLISHRATEGGSSQPTP